MCDFDVLVIGSGPAGTLIAASLAERGLKVGGLTATPVDKPWPNTYGIWEDELTALGLSGFLSHRWENTVSYYAEGEVKHDRAYGLIDKIKFQRYLLDRCAAGGVSWQMAQAQGITHQDLGSIVTTDVGVALKARVVVDASGHNPVFVKRQNRGPVAYQAAYGIVGRFSAPPVQPERFVHQDFRSDHLSDLEEAQTPPTFLYAMDLGQGVYLIEETSLALAPAMGLDVLERRLHQRLKFHGIEVTEVHEVERCLFPMTLPLPDLQQPVVAFGGAASMVNPASGYMMGALLRRAPSLADALASALADPQRSTQQIACAGWQGLWPADRLRKYYLYRFGLEKLMRFDEQQLKHFFDAFFSIPQDQWSGFLADELSTSQLVAAMVRLFMQAPNDVRWSLMQFPGQESQLLWQFLSLQAAQA
ncbi:lycopene cyclase family protein [Nodosilinea sp. LEGE 07298]|uniref:lycopene beta cyclase n=1 Tax=Nodosilinea sp. LEGE 07298 TaxID=2777970 RepID=UPI001882F256|nr:lycopene cyclase family protein [Nodosilinea sp. LEGE 07298]MBE9110029.1 lycopene cyclase family protein [Nodosilinea sp. LEGE 07298]